MGHGSPHGERVHQPGAMGSTALLNKGKAIAAETPSAMSPQRLHGDRVHQPGAICAQALLNKGRAIAAETTRSMSPKRLHDAGSAVSPQGVDDAEIPSCVEERAFVDNKSQ